MINYDFLSLSPYEFENFTRDLLQKHLSVYIESFATGKDGGVDLRFSCDEEKKIIIQAKRYKDYTNLLKNLKKEVPKVKRINPAQYILSTSVGLTPANKDEIQRLFSPYITDNKYIYGKDDLNNLLGLNKDIEQQYYKLWLGSVTILNRIIHSKIRNQSSFELELIQEQAKRYVQNKSFDEALKIIDDHSYIIISGIPGIGKTTLAGNIVLYYLLKNFEEFVYLNRIDDGYEYYSEEKKQIFFFDDFLGRNFFNERGGFNEDAKIVKFIEKIKRTPNKILIITTREYILNQAKKVFESFKINNIEIAKCTLGLSSYTNLIKAKIVYNHLFFSEIPLSYLQHLINNRNYRKIIQHQNYNPRIIETIIQYRIWERCPENSFYQEFISYFDNPQSVWQHAFENSIDQFSQYALLILLSLGTPVLLEDWELAVKEFFQNNNTLSLSFDPIQFIKSIRELENTFIKVKKDSFNTHVVEYHNPSIQDFLINYLENKWDIIERIIKSAVFSNQFFTIFTGKDSSRFEGKKIHLSEALIGISISRMNYIFEGIQSCSVFASDSPTEDYLFLWVRESNFIYSFLHDTFIQFAGISKEASSFVHEKFQEIIYLKEGVTDYYEQASYVELLSKLDLSKLVYEEDKIFDHFLKCADCIDSFELLSGLKKIFITFWTPSYEQEKIIPMLRNVVKYEMDVVEDSDIRDLIGKIDGLDVSFNVSFENEAWELADREIEYKYFSSLEDEDESNEREAQYEEMIDKEERQIQDLFDSLVG